MSRPVSDVLRVPVFEPYGVPQDKPASEQLEDDGGWDGWLLKVAG